MHQITDFLSFTAGLVATIVRSLYESLAGLLPVSVWMAVGVLVLVLVLHSRLASRIDEVEMALVQLNAKLDSILSRLARPREHDPGDRPRS